MILPLATKTRLYINGNIRSWIHYLQQRLDKHSQKEHRLIAVEIAKIFKDNFAMIYEVCFENE
jgi:thymidylate synthase (FAD)